jgi:hypothetical protein
MNDHYNDERLAKADQRPIDLTELIAHLADQQAHFSRHIDRRWEDLKPRQLAKLLSTHGQNADRLGRLLRDRRAIYGDRDEQVPQLIAQAREKLKNYEDYEPSFVPLGQEQEDDPSPLPTVDVDNEVEVDIDDVIADLADKQDRLRQLLDRLWSDPDAEHLDRLLAVYSHNAARLGRLLRHRTALYGQPADMISLAIDRALDRLSEQWGVDL